MGPERPLRQRCWRPTDTTSRSLPRFTGPICQSRHARNAHSISAIRLRAAHACWFAGLLLADKHLARQWCAAPGVTCPACPLPWRADVRVPRSKTARAEPCTDQSAAGVRVRPGLQQYMTKTQTGVFTRSVTRTLIAGTIYSFAQRVRASVRLCHRLGCRLPSMSVRVCVCLSATCPYVRQARGSAIGALAAKGTACAIRVHMSAALQPCAVVLRWPPAEAQDRRQSAVLPSRSA